MSGLVVPPVRAVVSACRVPGDAPHDTAHLRIFHPAADPGDDSPRLTGVFPVARDEGQRLPVVLLLNGINVGPEAHRWLAEELAPAGMVVVAFSYVAPLMPGLVGITPGVDVGAVTPDTWGTRPSCPTIGPILDHLAELDAGDGPLAGALDLDRVGLFGHSAGGTMVLQNADHRWHPTVRAGAAYGAHGLVSTMLGWDEGTLLPASGDVPLLLLGGTEDDVIARSADRYGDAGHATDPLTRTFDEALSDRGGEHALAWFEGANHFLPVEPEDPTVARGFLEGAPSTDPSLQRPVLATLLRAWFAHHLLGTPADEVEAALASPGITDVRRR